MARYLVNLRGTMWEGSVDEIFQHSLTINSVSASAGVATAVRDGWITLWNTGASPIKNMFTTGIKYTEVVSAEILNLSLGTVTAATHVPFTPVLAGAMSSGQIPSQCAIAISFTAGVRPNGVPLKGRSYMPTPSRDVVDTDGLLLAGSMTTLCNAWDTFLTNLKAAGHLPSVWSRSIPTTQTIDTVRVGSRMDTIRRRRNSHPESYQVQVV